MGFLVSPGVEVKEIDLTNVIPALSTSIGGFAGEFKWGPVDELITVSSEEDLKQIFGKPDATVIKSFLQAGGFLKYGNTLKVSRAVNVPVLEASADTPSTIGDLKDKDTTSATVGAKGKGLSKEGTDVGSTGTNNTNAEARVLVKNLTDWYATYESISKKVHAVARCPGEYGNSLKIIIGWSGSHSEAYDTPAGLDSSLLVANFDSEPNLTGNSPGTGGLVTDKQDEIQVLVIDKLGKITGTPNNVIEKFSGISLCTDAQNADGSSAYYFDVINNTSQFIYINKIGDAGVDSQDDVLFSNGDLTVDELNAATNDVGQIGTPDTTGTVTPGVAPVDTGYFESGLYSDSFSNGQDGDVTAGGYTDAIDLFADVDTVDVNLLMAGAGLLGATAQVTVDNDLIETATTRKDCVAFVSPGVGAGGADTEGFAVEKQTTEANKLKAVKARRTALNGLNSYSVMDGSPLYVYNKYADNFEFIAASGHIAGLCARTDGTNDPWFSPAGFNRGNLLGVTKLAFNPNQSSRDTLYKAQINPITSFPGQGIVLFGDKTGQVKASAFDRINVRRLFIVLEKAISTASKFSLFELNDEFTRAQFRNLVEPFLRDVKGRRGITDFLVVCDETNNTGQVIDTNRFVADIFIKPARSINFITLNFIATRTGVEFSELTN